MDDIKGVLFERKYLEKACQDCGVTVVTPHGLRDSFVTTYQHTTKDIKGASRMARHGDTRTTEKIYTHFEHEELVKIAKQNTSMDETINTLLGIKEEDI